MLDELFDYGLAKPGNKKSKGDKSQGNLGGLEELAESSSSNSSGNSSDSDGTGSLSSPGSKLSANKGALEIGLDDEVN